ncbi:MAG: hypothetical protein HQM08_03880 [Candidatus Riflebacteria bacterium]|nr:hypothetical protein [Candidatus Riflebacteria bacterium]
MSISLAPLFYLIKLTKMAEQRSEMEFSATLLAHHVMEKIVALSLKNPDKLPPLSPEKSIISTDSQGDVPSEYFTFLEGKYKTLSSEDSPELYTSLKPFKCQVDTYFLEDSLYKIIVYIIFEEDHIKKRIYLERLIVLNNLSKEIKTLSEESSVGNEKDEQKK